MPHFYKNGHCVLSNKGKENKNIYYVVSQKDRWSLQHQHCNFKPASGIENKKTQAVLSVDEQAETSFGVVKECCLMQT